MTQAPDRPPLNEIRGLKWAIFERSSSMLGLVVLGSGRLASRLNRTLTNYDDSVRFTDEDEPLFIIPKQNIAAVMALMSIKHLPVWAKT